ncbi:type IV pilus biogenesis/stability protein PilW [Conchiformibius steedae]|uniref:Type IV pilus biogenesis/stability protein PilW n=1 Tax=Conchiformibius steedae TaxID=153493 RepID=A0A3P2A634_9NEIS|nr:type IV pilus biogenesis/stability protein PilW [Conchiformibius steedae]RRD90368.1 type IV pilus biogenesis/stability protein PilW [Conchiformibius steedae]
MKKPLFSLTLALCLLGTAGCVTEGSGANLTKFKPLSGKERTAEAARIKTQLAIEYMNTGDYRSATATIEEALKNDRKYDMAWLTRAQIFQFLKVYEKAEASFKEALKISPAGAEINNNYGWFLCSIRNNPLEALPHFDKALADPTYPAPEVANLNKGICNAKLHKYDEADRFFERALNINPDFVAVFKERARVMLARDNIKEADHFFRQYQKRVDILNADDLLLGWRIARAEEDMQKSYEYEATLREHYPYSDELNTITRGNPEP